MQALRLIVVASGAILVQVGWAGEKGGESLNVPGLFSIGAPAKGYKWKAVSTTEIQGIKSRVFLCVSNESSARVVLVVEQRTANTDATRSPTVAAHWNSLIETLKDKGFKNVKGQKPSVQAPIPDRVDLSISAIDPNGNPVFICGATVFGKNIYGLRTVANTREEAERLVAVLKSFKER